MSETITFNEETWVTWTEAAWERFKAVEQRHADIYAYFGKQLADEHEAQFLRLFARLTFAAGPVNVQTDGEDSFLIITPHIVCGLIWTPDSDTKMQTRIGTNIDPTWPRTGQWSAHS
jgi:hypothetical protein